MSKQLIEIEVPDGYELIAYRAPTVGCQYLHSGEIRMCNNTTMSGQYPIVKKTRISLHQFYFDAITFIRDYNARVLLSNQWRYGQGMFNRLAIANPTLAEKVRGTNCDPFHCESPADPQFDRFVEFIESNWDK